LLFSAVSAWELGLLVEKKRLAFVIPVETWVNRFVSRPGIRVIPLDLNMALRATSLPQPFVHDPADRFLVSTARILSVPILTRDKHILDYSRAGHVRAIAC
jgi:PIN domain nuclease of toxin-antitoxin system